MDKNELIGTGKDVLGKVKDGAGGLTGDVGLQAEGKVDQLEGNAQKAMGNTVDAVREGADMAASKASDWAGHAGETLSNAAASAREGASVLVEQATEAGARAGRYVGETVQKQPVLSLIGLAALAYAAAFFIHSPSSPFIEQPPRRRYRL